MLSVIMSPKFQIVIPKEIRESLHLVPGQRMQVIQYENRIELIPERDIGELEGFLKGIDTSFTKEDDRLWMLSILQGSSYTLKVAKTI